MQRKLAAIMAIDIVGYSALMAEDELGTLRVMKACRSDQIEPAVAANGGRVFKLLGDGMLVEFASAVGAVKAALSIQDALAKDNAAIQLRIGISLGDVIADGDDLYGHGVNVATRLEGLAGRGGVCVSDVVHQQSVKHVGVQFDDAGEVTVKNIDTPMKVWHWPSLPSCTEPKPSETTPKASDRPSIAVLPFENLSSDPEQRFFCDAMTEEVVTALSKIERLAVMDRASTKSYEAASADVRKIGREQNVRFALRGSVRRQGDRIRVLASLSDTRTGQTIYAERYDRQVDDIFDIQDEITREIASSLQVKLTDGEQARLWASGTRKLEAWEKCIRAAELVDQHKFEENREGKRLLEEALRSDPKYAVAWCKLGWAHWSDARHGWTSDPLRSLNEAKQAAQTAHALDPDFSEPFALLAMSAVQAGEFENASEYVDEALQRAGGQSFVLATVAMVLSLCGRPIDAIDVMHKAKALCPIYPDWYQVQLGRSYYLAGDYDAAAEVLEEVYDRNPSVLSPVLLIAALSESGRTSEAKEIIRAAEASGSPLSITSWSRSQSFSDPSIIVRVRETLNALGVFD